jgi:hypothetical protein
LEILKSAATLAAFFMLRMLRGATVDYKQFSESGGASTQHARDTAGA